MKIFFRVDSSQAMGSGHLMRCLALADMLSGRGCVVSFISRECAGNMSFLAERKGYKVHRLSSPMGTSGEGSYTAVQPGWPGFRWETDAAETAAILGGECAIDWLIADHYGLDRRWEERIRPYVRKIMVIDDLANRPHDCDVLLDQNHHPRSDGRYEELVPPECRIFLGPRHALLRKEFFEARKVLRDRDGVVRRILVFMGGSDPTNETGKAVEALRLLNRPDIAVDVVIGDANLYKREIARACSLAPNTNLFVQVDTIASMMGEADLSIGGGGIATWERCWMGLPAIVVILADNQAEIANAVAVAGAGWNLGWWRNVEPRHIMNAVRNAMDHPEVLRAMGKKALDLVGNPDGKPDDTLYRVLLGEHDAPA